MHCAWTVGRFLEVAWTGVNIAQLARMHGQQAMYTGSERSDMRMRSWEPEQIRNAACASHSGALRE
jgi:hypothetical protein